MSERACSAIGRCRSSSCGGPNGTAQPYIVVAQHRIPARWTPARESGACARFRVRSPATSRPRCKPERAIVQHGLLRLGMRGLDHLGLGLTVKLCTESRSRCRPAARRSARRRPNRAFFTRRRSNCLRELRAHAMRLGKNHHAGDRPVEPVGNAEIDLGRVAGPRGQVASDARLQAFDARRGLRGDAGRLVHGQARASSSNRMSNPGCASWSISSRKG